MISTDWVEVVKLHKQIIQSISPCSPASPMILRIDFLDHQYNLTTKKLLKKMCKIKFPERRYYSYKKLLHYTV